MFQVKIDTIRERTTNGPTYMKGRQYYRDGQIKHLSFDQDKGLILAQVEGTRTYDVRILLDSGGDLHDATCTCSAFAAYWGLCRHIAAVLLYCVDAYGKEKTHIQPANKPDALLTGSPHKPGKPARDTEKSRQQAIRRSRTRARDFMTRLEHVVSLVDTEGKTAVNLQVLLHGIRNSSTLPWLSFAVGTDSFHAVTNVEQFAEAVSRDLPLELDKDFTLDPQVHCFRSQDLPLIRMVQDAFENDYKAVFGTSHASSRDRFFTLNASRFADFLQFSSQLSDCAWQMTEQEKLPIQVRRSDLPVSLHLSYAPGTDRHTPPYRLEMICRQNIQQLTASRNIYLVDDVFYLPGHDSIRLLEPVLATFNTTGSHVLTLTDKEASWLISIMSGPITSACPLTLADGLKHRLVDEPLQAVVALDASGHDLKAEPVWAYGPVQIKPLQDKQEGPEDQGPLLLKRQFRQENKVLSCLEQAGFSQQGSTLRLSDPDALYLFLDQTLGQLQALADVRLSAGAKRLVIHPAPRLSIRLAWSESQDGLVLQQVDGGLSGDERVAYFQALRDRKPYVRNRDGSFRMIDLAWRDLLLPVYDLLRTWHVENETECRLPRYRALALEPHIAGHDLTWDPAIDPDPAGPVVVDNRIIELVRHLKEPGSLAFRLPAALNKQLRPYQKTGVHWLCTLDYYGLGGILADDMGLGKTLQTITYVQMQWRKKHKTALIIAPTSLIYNWLSEFSKFSPRLPVLLIDGNRQQRTSLFSEIGRHACVITSYALLRRDIDDLKDYPFGSCFLDEAQNIKNPDTLNARCVKQIQAERAFALTGTPLENSLLELWSIFDFILPGYLYSQRVFQSLYEVPIMRDNDAALLKDLHRQIMPFVLRRMKKDVLKELPDKIESHTVCDMTEKQRQIYDAFLARSRDDLKQELAANGYSRSQIYILALLTRLRQICCHPALFLKQYDGGSGKLLLLEELLADCFSAGHRVLVFSQFTSMLELIKASPVLQDTAPFYIDGQVPSEERLSQVERFNGGEGKLFLISLRAGGTGLNLTGADTVIHYDPWWNPAVEEQATDRAYRIGQENIVQVFKLYTRHSVEEKILSLQQKKQQLIDAVIKPGQNLLSKMTLDEVMSLFDS